eukprot:TRINITY_DN1959_c0_g1_i1.p1 TRINITY_DN1959_c0_g1~~TRINITY_DN1959_c0_g1_i1.p1  ORF type:complete len:499 (+),score=86.06 TRINITY_DN1959_c0_g1_i1:132-1499(+)
MLMFGGYSLQQRQFYNDIVSFDFETKEWQELLVSGQAPSKRRAHSCTVMAGGMLVIFGGYNGDYCLNDVHTFDSETHQWSKRECTGEIPAHRGGHTAVAWHGTKMVVHGGWDVGNVYFDCTYVLDTETWSWEKLQVTSAYKPVGRVGHASVLHDQRYLYTFGGYGTEGYWDDLNRLDLRSGQWEIVKVVGDCVPCQRTFSSMEIVGNRILLFGGSNHDVEMNDVMVFDTENHSWEFINCPGQVPEGRFAHVSCMYNHKLYLYGGIVRGSGELNGMYELTLERFTCDHSLVHLLQAWIVHSGMDHRLFADSLPSPLVAQLDAYQQQVMEMRELEAAALGPKAPPTPSWAGSSAASLWTKMRWRRTRTFPPMGSTISSATQPLRPGTWRLWRTLCGRCYTPPSALCPRTGPLPVRRTCAPQSARRPPPSPRVPRPPAPPSAAAPRPMPRRRTRPAWP